MAIISGIQALSFYNPDDGTVIQVDKEDLSNEIAFTSREAEPDEKDPTGGHPFAGDYSELEVPIYNFDGIATLKNWSKNDVRISMVAAGLQQNIQWYERDRISIENKLIIGQSGRLNKFVLKMRRKGQGQHDIHGKVNLLDHRGWRGSDENSDGFPDGYDDNGAWTSPAFTDADGDGIAEQFAAYGPIDGSSAVLRISKLPFPIAGIDVAQSLLVNQLHDDGITKAQLLPKNFNSSILEVNESTFASTGRKSVSGTTPPETFYIQSNILVVTGATAQTAKAAMADPALRVDGKNEFAQY